ncbi:PEPxxWA-CTERM sorting domain-containing protein [Sphingomonas elodea]
MPPAVPEPSGWAMMIASMFLVGGVMRYRNRSKVTE